MRAALLFLAIALAACASPQRPSPFLADDAPEIAVKPPLDDLADVIATSAKGAPRLYVLEKNGKRLTLFGTMHLTPRGFRWLSPAALRAFTEAELVLTEVGSIDPGQYSPRARDFDELVLLAVRDDGVDTRDLVALPGTAERATLDAAIEFTGITSTGAARSKPWGLCTDLMRGERPGAMQRMSADARMVRMRAIEAVGQVDLRSPDARLEAFRRSHDLAHLQLETFTTRARAYATMSDADAIACIRNRAVARISGEEARRWPERFKRTLALWQAGDADGARREAVEENAAISPGFAQRLLQGREDQWLKIIAERCEAANISCAVAVGFAHLGGEDGLLARLRSQGWREAGGET